MIRFHRKYRPDLKQYKGHYKEWWQFAYKCVLEEDVLRRQRNWDWNHMLSHRQLCKDYASAYQNKLTCQGKVSTEHQCVLEKAEKTLDLFNLVVIRQQIELEVLFGFNFVMLVIIGIRIQYLRRHIYNSYGGGTKPCSV